MAGIISLGDEDWSGANWLYEFVLSDLRAATSPASAEVIDRAAALDLLDLDDFPATDRPAVRSALGPPLVEHFGATREAGTDTAAVDGLLRDLGAMAQKLS